MILLGMWGRNYTAAGELEAFPANAWAVYLILLDQLAPYFDGLQLPPAALTASGTAASGDGYGVREYRNLNGTYWGDESQLIALAAAVRAKGKKLFGDFPLRQMDGENCGPGCFTYDGRPGAMTPSCFQYFGQPGETKPPFVAQDDIPDTQGDTPYGRVRSYQNCIPAGYVEEDARQILAYYKATVDYYGGRMDEAKAIHVQTMARLVASAEMDLYGEYMSGNIDELLSYAAGGPMNGAMGLEDYAFYWGLQRACNGYDATQLAANNGGLWGLFQVRPDLAVTFFANPDVNPSRGANGGISEQIAFNLGLAAALVSCVPARVTIMDAQAYWPAGSTFPGAYGLQDLINNICWFARTFAIGNWEQRWLDTDVAAYTRDGDGGAIGWSGGCLVAVNFNTLTARTITVQTMWSEGQSVHNYSATGSDEYYTVGAGGLLTVTIKSNYYSNGQSYVLIAPSGVS